MILRSALMLAAVAMATAAGGCNDGDAPEGESPALRKLTLDLADGLRIRLVLIPAGSFMMGSPETEDARFSHEGPQGPVTISTPFYMAVTEVTQAQWRAIMATEPWKQTGDLVHAREGDDNAASHISSVTAMAFCRKLSEKTGRDVRLPTEAQWEYACRAGATTRFSYGDDPDYSRLTQYAWYDVNAFNTGHKYAHEVAQKRPNAWGLYDMHGNLWEWCSDWYHHSSYTKAASVDPKGAAGGPYRILRGGSWATRSSNCRSAHRSPHGPQDAWAYSGFRIVVTAADAD